MEDFDMNLPARGDDDENKHGQEPVDDVRDGPDGPVDDEDEDEDEEEDEDVGDGSEFVNDEKFGEEEPFPDEGYMTEEDEEGYLEVETDDEDGNVSTRILDDDDLGNGEDGDSTKRVVIEKPTKGMEFELGEDFIAYIHRYAFQNGFAARTKGVDLPRNRNGLSRPSMVSGHRVMHDQYKEHVRIRMCCRKEGKFKSKAKCPSSNTTTCKTGCLWLVNANRSILQGSFWRITTVRSKHNHKIDKSYSRHLPRYRRISMADKETIIEMSNANVSVPQIYNMFVVKYCGYNNVPFTEVDTRNFLHFRYWQPLRSGDFVAMEMHFKKMIENSPNFFYEYDVDKENKKLKNVFWADSRCIEAFKEFGDVVSFDTTFVSNRYRMPFAPFIGVNHHGKSLLLGCALLGKEDTDTFVWLFKVWRKCMGKDPVCMITDQEKAIGNAIQIVFPNTRHRWCIWHIMRNGKKHLGCLALWKDIKSDLQNVLHDSYTIFEFERSWMEWCEKYDLAGYSWVKDMYVARSRWVPAYFKSEFWAGMSSTQRSEGMNNYFKGFVNINTSLTQFAEKYGLAVCKRIEDEEKDCFNAYNRRCRVSEKQTHRFEIIYEKLYTRSKFVEFREEVMDMSLNSAVVVSDDGDYAVFNVLVKEYRSVMTKRSTFVVTLDRKTMCVKCDCRNFEFKGILCAHALRVFWHEETLEVPERYVFSRWRKDIPRPYLKIDYPLKCLLGKPSPWLHRYRSLNQVSEDICIMLMNNEKGFKEALRCMRKLKEKIQNKYALPEGISSDVRDGIGKVYRKFSKSRGDGDPEAEKPIWEEDDANVVKDPTDRRGRGNGQRKRKKSFQDLPGVVHGYSTSQHNGSGKGKVRGSPSSGMGRGTPGSTPGSNFFSGFAGPNQSSYSQSGGSPFGMGRQFNSGIHMNPGTTKVPIFNNGGYGNL